MPPERASSAVGETTVIVGPGAGRLRRQLGAMAWVTFETLAGVAEVDQDVWFCVASIRAMAADIGVNKDTVTRAIAALESAKLIERQAMLGASSASPTRYRLVLPDGVSLACPKNSDTARRPTNEDSARLLAEAETDRRPGNLDTTERPGIGDKCRDGVSLPACPPTSDTATWRNALEPVAPAAGSGPDPAGPATADGSDQRRIRRPRASADVGGQGALFDTDNSLGGNRT
jgi:hypothetical protein